MCRAVRWFVPVYTEEERLELLDSVLGRRQILTGERKLTELSAEV